jgi:hypothetical protein
MKRKLFAVSLVVFAFVFLAAFPQKARADFYLKQKMHTDAMKMMGQSIPAKDEIQATWITKDKARSDTGAVHSMILRVDAKKIYALDNTAKTYTEMPLGSLEEMIVGAVGDNEKMTKEEKEQAAQAVKGMAAMMKMEAKVQETAETKKINTWNCKKYIMTMTMPMGTTTSEIWATEDIKIDYDLYQALANAMMSQMQGFQEMIKEIKKIKGLPVLTTTTVNMMGAEVKSSTELIEAKEASAPAGIFEVPGDYKKGKGFGMGRHGE